jgi:uncharacterized protein YecE (DUF72 family)
MPTIRIGISGWTYEPWRGAFYPEGLKQKRELEYASRKLNSIELNGSFYSLQSPTSYRKWFDETPDDFVFSVKGGQFVTHIKRLRDVRIPIANFFASGVFGLNQKLGPIFWQFPPNFQFDQNLFDEFFAILPHSTKAALKLAGEHQMKATKKVLLEIDQDRPMRHAVEVRHQSFDTGDFIALARQHDIAVVIADTKKWPAFDELTSDYVYARLHGEEETYSDGYTDQALDAWAKRIKKWSKTADVYVYFDNDLKVRSPIDAMNLAKKLGLQQSSN